MFSFSIYLFFIYRNMILSKYYLDLLVYTLIVI